MKKAMLDSSRHQACSTVIAPNRKAVLTAAHQVLQDLHQHCGIHPPGAQRQLPCNTSAGFSQDSYVRNDLYNHSQHLPHRDHADSSHGPHSRNCEHSPVRQSGSGQEDAQGHLIDHIPLRRRPPTHSRPRVRDDSGHHRAPSTSTHHTAAHHDTSCTRCVPCRQQHRFFNVT